MTPVTAAVVRVIPKVSLKARKSSWRGMQAVRLALDQSSRGQRLQSREPNSKKSGEGKKRRKENQTRTAEVYDFKSNGFTRRGLDCNSITSFIAYLSCSTWNTVKAAERFSFPADLSGPWGADLTAHRNRHLNNKPTLIFKHNMCIPVKSKKCTNLQMYSLHYFHIKYPIGSCDPLNS